MLQKLKFYNSAYVVSVQNWYALGIRHSREGGNLPILREIMNSCLRRNDESFSYIHF
jgi:hypothetical protein